MFHDSHNRDFLLSSGKITCILLFTIFFIFYLVLFISLWHITRTFGNVFRSYFRFISIYFHSHYYYHHHHFNFLISQILSSSSPFIPPLLSPHSFPSYSYFSILLTCFTRWDIQCNTLLTINPLYCYLFLYQSFILYINVFLIFGKP